MPFLTADSLQESLPSIRFVFGIEHTFFLELYRCILELYSTLHRTPNSRDMTGSYNSYSYPREVIYAGSTIYSGIL